MTNIRTYIQGHNMTNINEHKEDFKSMLQCYASMVFCNQEEAVTLLETDVTQEAVDIMSKWTETVVLTLSANAAIISHLGQTYYIDPFPIRVEDTTGAGDIFAGAFLKYYADTNSLANSIEFANVAASLSVESYGVIESIPKSDEIINHL